MQLELGVARSLRYAAGDRLDVVERFGARARDIGQDAFPARAAQERGKGRALPEQLWPDRKARRDRVPLLLAARFEQAIEERGLEGFELLGRERVRHHHEPVAVEARFEVGGQQMREALAAPPGEPMRRVETPHVESRPVEAPRTEQGIVDEALGPRQKRSSPERRAPPAKDASGRKSLCGGRSRANRRGTRVEPGVEGHRSSLEYLRGDRPYPAGIAYPTDDPG